MADRSERLGFNRRQWGWLLAGALGVFAVVMAATFIVTIPFMRTGYTPAELISLKRRNPEIFRKTIEGRTLEVSGTMFIRPEGVNDESGFFVVTSLETTNNLSHNGPTVGVFFRQRKGESFTPKFLNWARVARDGDYIAISGIVVSRDNEKMPLVIENARLLSH